MAQISGIPSARWLAAMLATAVIGSVGPADAQVAPSAAEVSRYGSLHAAAHRGDVAEIERLIAAKADLNLTDSYGRTPLHVATHARKAEAVRALMRAGARQDLLERDRYDGVTIAAVANDAETLRVLLALGASAKLITSRYDGTALIAASHLGHHGVVKQLIAAGAPLDHVNNLHWTAVIEAIVLGDGGARHTATLKALIEAGANVNLADRNGTTPLRLARMRGYTAMTEMLERAGAR